MNDDCEFFQTMMAMQHESCGMWNMQNIVIKCEDHEHIEEEA